MSEEQTIRKNNRGLKMQVGISLLVLAIVLFVLTTFEFLYAVKEFMLGVFGVTLYPILFFLGLIGVALIMNKRFVYSPKYVLYLCLAFFFLVCSFHIIFTWEAGEKLAYGDFLMMCYHKMYTPGGLLIGVFTYALTGLLNSMAGLVIYLIGFVISLYLIISYLEGVKQQARKGQIKPEYQTFEFTNNEESPLDENMEISSDEEDDNPEEDAEDEGEENDEIFIKDEEDEEITQTELAREKLGLAPAREIKKEDAEEESASSKLFKQDIDPWQNRAFKEEKPQKFVYNTPYVSKKKDEKNNQLIEKNKEYLSTIHDLNNVNENPIINAEDFDDYKEKMRLYNEKHMQRLKREDILNQTIKQGRDYQNNNYDDGFEDDEDFENDDEFGIEPEHNFEDNKIVDLGDDFEGDEDYSSYEPDEDEDDDGYKGNDDNNFYDDDFEDDLDDNFDEDDYIKSDFEENENKKSQTHHDRRKEERALREERSQKFIEESKKTAGTNTIEESLNKKFEVNTNRNFNFDVIGMSGNASAPENKPKEPDFAYNSNYVRPPIDLLMTYKNEEDLTTDHEKNIQALEEVLEEFKIPAKVEAVRRGAAVTRYELHMPVGVPVRKIFAHTSDIALALAAKSDIRIEAPIKGKSAVGVEVPNNKIDTVGLKEIISSPEFMNAKAPLTFALGKNVDGEVYCCNLAKTPHLLVAGSTGSGKSVCLNALILSLIYRTSPEDLRFILVDPKLVEFSIYNNLPHMLLPKAITEPKKALKAFDWLIDEMERRYAVFQSCFVRNLNEYNSQPEVISKKLPKLPYIVLIVDELADLVVTTNKKELEERIIRLTQKARAAGIHLILATQRPSVDIITGSIKINLPTRIAFAVTNFNDSKTIIDHGGAEKLLGKGDMLYSPRDGEPTRVQGAFVDAPEVKAIVDYVKEHNKTYYDDNISKEINSEGGNNEGGGFNGGSLPSVDSLMKDALKHVVENGQASISMLQRRFAIGYQRAAKIIDQMEAAGFISGSDGSKPRSVYMTLDDYYKIYGEN